jgi:hypothetical protein
MTRPFIKPISINQVPNLQSKALGFKLRAAIGEALNYFLKPYQDQLELSRVNYVLRARSPGNELGKEEIEALGEYQTSTFDLDLRKQYFRKSLADGILETDTLHGLVIPLIKRIINADKSVRSIVDIGCNYAFIDHLLSKEYPNIKFVGVDVPKAIVSINADLASENLNIISGYALNLIKAGELKGDVFYFSSTATAIKTAELKNYLGLFSMVAKYVVFNEPLFVLPNGRVVNPDEVSIEESEPISVARSPLNNEYGYLCRAHNYSKLLDISGFDTVHYEIYRPEFTNIYWVRAIGQNRNHGLWKQA